MFIYHTDVIYCMDVDNLIKSATEIAHDEVPLGGGNSSEVVEALSKIFEAYPGKFFKSQRLSEVLNNNGIPVVKIGNILYAMKNSKKCSQVAKGVYSSYDSKYDGNIRTPTPSSTEQTQD